MNLFRIAADLSHLASILILLYSIEKHKSVEGLSLKTQSLYVLVFVTRYLDLFTRYVSLYNTLMKIFFISSSIYVVYLMAKKYSKSIKADLDTFPMRYLTGGAAIMLLIFTYSYYPSQILWLFLLWLEAVAILPQLFILQRSGEAENITVHYIAALGIYRALYIPNWIYRYFAEGRFDWIAILAGTVQTLVYSDFFYIYYTKVMRGKKFSLPV